MLLVFMGASLALIPEVAVAYLREVVVVVRHTTFDCNRMTSHAQGGGIYLFCLAVLAVDIAYTLFEFFFNKVQSIEQKYDPLFAPSGGRASQIILTPGRCLL